MLTERGWNFLSDDVAPVRMHADEVIPFPQTPVRRLYPGHEVDPEHLGSIPRERVSIGKGSIRDEPAAIGGVVIVEYRRGASASLKRLEPGPAALEILRNVVNFVDHKGAAVARAAAMAMAVPIYRLCYDAASDAIPLLQNGLP
jgi:hypothetical protein